MKFGAIERRTQSHLRDIFDRAYDVEFPLLHSIMDSQSGGSVHFLHVSLHEEFPNLHKQDIALLSATLQRVFRERNKPEGQ